MATVVKKRINLAPHRFIYKQLLKAALVLVITGTVGVCGYMGYDTYKRYTDMLALEEEVSTMQQFVDNSRLDELERLREQYAQLTATAGEDSFIPATKYTYTEMFELVKKHLPDDFYLYGIVGELGKAGVYSYNITIYSAERKDISEFLREIQGEDIIYCTLNSILPITVEKPKVANKSDSKFVTYWVYTLQIQVGGI